MKITIESTSVTTTIGGVTTRLWEGVTEKGTKCKLFVHRIAVDNRDDSSEFERELEEQLPPTRSVPLSEIL